MNAAGAPPGFHNYGDRPPAAPPFCSCPWHCPVTWDSYESMMNSWTKGGPPPGYWYPPPPTLHQPQMGRLENQTGTATGNKTVQVAGTQVQHSEILPVKQSANTGDSEEELGLHNSSVQKVMHCNRSKPFSDIV